MNEMQVNSRHLNKYSDSLAIREMQIEMTRDFTLSQLDGYHSKFKKSVNAVEDVGEKVL